MGVLGTHFSYMRPGKRHIRPKTIIFSKQAADAQQSTTHHPELQKRANRANQLVLFFSAGANFWPILGHFWAILSHFWAILVILGNFGANLANFGSFLG